MTLDELLAFFIVNIGISYECFYKANFRQLKLMVDQYHIKEKKQAYIGNYRAALICSVLANTHSKKKFKIEDFMPKEKQKEQTWEQQFEIVKMLNAAFGGEVNYR